MSLVTIDQLMPFALGRRSGCFTLDRVQFWFNPRIDEQGRRSGWVVLAGGEELGHVKTLKEAAWSINHFLRRRGAVQQSA